MRLLDSRRLTGPNLLCDRPGAIIDVSFVSDGASSLSSVDIVGAWERQARVLLDAVGWAEEETSSRVWPGGASLAITAPVDALYAATELNDLAWDAAVAELDGGELPTDAISELRHAIEAERNPAILSLKTSAAAHRVAFLMDDERVSVGLGAGSKSWALEQLPDPGQVDWSAVRDIPVALVTGTNGKTTTVRLLAAIGRAAGLTVGNTSTDGVQVDGEIVLKGDYTGPEGARSLLRDPRVEMAVLEVARGGMLRRGLPVTHAEVALVANVAPDHLGDYGIHDVESLADAKMVVARALAPESRLILNADDPLIVARADSAPCPITWISALPGRAAAEADELWRVENGIVLSPDAEPFLSVIEVPITHEGAARYNVYNVLGAIAVARATQISDEAIREGLRGFAGTQEQNIGRGNVFELGGVRAIVDFAHNPHGFEAVFEMVGNLSPGRWLVTVGQAGDRDDEEIRELARLVWAAGPDRVIVKELPKKLRGREPGEVPRLIEGELLDLGAPTGAIERADSDFDAVRKALAWAREGDLLLLLLHEERAPSLDLLNNLAARGWTPGSQL